MATTKKGYCNGSDMLLYVDGKAVGHCTSHSTTLTTETKDRAVKPVATAEISAGLWKGKGVTGLSVSISAATGWNLTAFGDKSSLAGEKVDSNKIGFAISIGGGAQVATASNEATQNLITAPIEGCYMTGVGDSSRNSVAIDYDAIVTPLSSAVEGANVANVVFVIEWDDVTE